MSYENSPQCKLVATRCAVCAHKLVDSLSVETGVGPDCRKKYGYGQANGPANWEAAGELTSSISTALRTKLFEPEVWGRDPQRAANIVVYAIALNQEHDDRNRWIAGLAKLGFVRLAKACARKFAIEITKEKEPGAEPQYLLKTPYDEQFTLQMRAVPGQGWHDYKTKIRSVPVSSRRQLWAVLKRCFAGQLLIVDQIDCQII